jgi:predicted DNA-binding mobile mystery protein A
MSTQLRRVQIRQMEEKLRPWRSLAKTPPRRGWVRTIREVLGMTVPQLAHRLRVTRQAVADLEHREAQGRATLVALEAAAKAMNCDLVYAIVPRRELGALLEEQAKQRASSQISRVAHTMRLEAQNVADEETQRLIDDSAASLLLGNPRKLWATSERQPKPLSGRD